MSPNYLDSARWRLREKIRRALLATDDGHFLRRGYRLLREIPGIRGLWKKVSGGETWRDVERYAAAGGRFLAAPAGKASALAPFGEEAHFDELIARIRASALPAQYVRKRIVHINNGLSAGGAERQIVATLKGLKERGFDPLFIGEKLGLAPGLDFHYGALTGAGVAIEPLLRRSKPGGDLYAGVSKSVAEALAAAPADDMLEILDMAARLKELAPQAVHLWQDETSTRHAFSALIAGTPRIVMSGRNVNPTHFSYHRPHMRAAYRALARAPEVLFVNNSAAGADSYADWLGVDRARIHVIYNGLDIEAFPARSKSADEARQRLGLTVSGKLVAGVFRLSAEKRPSLWLHTAAETIKARADVRFAIAGSGPLLDEARKLAAEIGGGRIFFLGEIEDIASLYSAADLFFLSSSEEGTPNAAIEAQHYGLPVIATDAGGVSEAMADRETGFLINSNEAQSIAQILLRALDDADLRARARTQGPSFVRARFSLPRMIDETVNLYDVVIN